MTFQELDPASVDEVFKRSMYDYNFSFLPESKQEDEVCLCCGCKLRSCDGGDPVCARCNAEEAHDYDVEPDIEFDRQGRVIDND